MENAPLMINGKNVDHCTIQELQKFAKETKGQIQYIGKPEPLLRGYIKMFLRNNPGIAEQNTNKPEASAPVVVSGLNPEPESKEPEKTKTKAQKPKTVMPKKSKVKKAKQTKKKVKAVEMPAVEKIVEPVQPKRIKRPYARPLTASEIEKLCAKSDVKKILKLECKLHVKMYKLHHAGFSRKQIAAICETLEGHVWNELMRYSESQERRDKAEEIKH